MKKRSLVAAIAMLVVSAIVLTSATFAWFTMGKTVSVEQFSASVSEADGLLISAYQNKDFNTSVSLDAIREAADSQLKAPAATAVISPVSSNGVTTSGVKSFVEGYINESSQLVTATATDGSYYQLPVYIKYSGTEDATIKLTGTTVTAGTGSKGTSAYKAVRIATDKADYIFAPNSDSGETFSCVTTTGTGVSATSITNVATAADSNNLSFTLAAGSTTKILVYVWLEGTDSLCTDDAAAGGDFVVDLSFVKV